MTRLLRHEPAIAASLDHLTTQAPEIRGLGVDVATIDWVRFTPGFPGLVRIILGQQISSRIADALWFRLADEVGGDDAVTPRYILGQTGEALRPFGFSAQKTRYARTLAQRIEDGLIEPAALSGKPDEEVIRAITAELGFGRWSAQMYLLFCLARPNVLPEGDLVFDRKVQALYGLDARPDPDTLRVVCAAHDGHFTALTLLLWKAELNARP